VRATNDTLTNSFDSFPAWTDLVSSFSHPVGNHAQYSLRALATRVPFEYFAREDGSLFFYVPTVAPPSLYTYGGNAAAGEHEMWPGVFGRRPTFTYFQLVGNPPRSQAGESLDISELYNAGRMHTMIINNRQVTTDPETTVLANALLVAHQERKHAGQFEAPPNFALQPGDVISFGQGPTYAAGEGNWRVEVFEEFFNQPGPRPFFQRITVRGTA
jgi:hypothetical protein